MPTTNNELLITSVVVFPDRARVARSGRLSLTTGLQRVAVADLPLALVTDSVRASGSGAAKAKLLGVSTHLEQYLETPAEIVRELEAKIQATEDADNDLIARAGVLEKEGKSLDGLAAQSEMYARGLALRNRSTEEQGALFDFITARAQTLQAEILKIGRERRERAKELDQLRRQLKNTQAARPRQRYTATVELEVLTAGDLDLELTYVVTGASWTPLYDLRYADSSLNVTCLAQVAQNTGEDWTNVALTLSTAQPALALVIPELDPWYVRPLPPPRPKMVARSMVAAAAPASFAPQAAEQMQTLAAVAEPESHELTADSAAISDSGPSLTYRLSGRADIPGNNDPRKVTVATFPLKPAIDYVTAPKQEQVCYRRATIKNESQYTLLPGPAQLFEGDDYLGATRLDFCAPGQEFELALGADERLRVERELAQRDVDKTFIGDRRRIRFAYTIKLENLRDAPQTILVRDQLPVPRDEQIKVKLESAEPKPTKHTDLNQLEWKLTLDKSAKQTLRFDFTVEYPRAMEVIGLP
ncbi:MAG: mucoidy inhibitor MuiA family protein [Chloroflexi bacterium]|nr:mucoidy inhibitor MuiA family protein [Chloroflexota bacterium]